MKPKRCPLCGKSPEVESFPIDQGDLLARVYCCNETITVLRSDYNFKLAEMEAIELWNEEDYDKPEPLEE